METEDIKKKKSFSQLPRRRKPPLQRLQELQEPRDQKGRVLLRPKTRPLLMQPLLLLMQLLRTRRPKETATDPQDLSEAEAMDVSDPETDVSPRRRNSSRRPSRSTAAARP